VEGKTTRFDKIKFQPVAEEGVRVSSSQATIDEPGKIQLWAGTGHAGIDIPPDDLVVHFRLKVVESEGEELAIDAAFSNPKSTTGGVETVDGEGQDEVARCFATVPSNKEDHQKWPTEN